jgi:hypothetical protein
MILYRRKQAADYVKERFGFCTARSLAKYATVGGGPPMIYIGKIPFYRPEWLDAWVLSKMSRPVRSTSERREAGDSEAGGAQ